MHYDGRKYTFDVASMNLYPSQADVLDAGLLDSGFSCLLQMATGSGKTWLAQHAVDSVLARGYRAIYLAPLKALAAELADAWQRHLPNHRVGIFTGDFGGAGRDYPTPFHEAELLVMTPERLDFCTRSWRSHWNWVPLIDLVVVDEFHLLGDGRRGARLEGALSRLQRLNPFARLLCLSATLGNRTELANWLDAVEYDSDWRPIPLDWRIVRFRRADDKPLLLRQVVAECVGNCGKSLVFVQSRRRAEQLAQQLGAAGFRAVHHHAGLSQVQRKQVEDGFRARDYDVLVATSTLEMGLNLPVRQVVLYDIQQFDGQGYGPLSVNSVWQRVGRAGRPGLDATGEAVLLAPAWDRDAERYQDGKFEPIRSGFADERALAEQVVVEVAGRYVRTRAQVQALMARCLAAHQGRLSAERVRAVVDALLDAGMLTETGEQDEGPERLQVTRTGRVAVRHMLYPATVRRFMDACMADALSFFDLLLLAASAEDCEPVLPVDFEELSELERLVAAEPSSLLAGDGDVAARLGVGGKRLLSSLKMALTMRALTRGEDCASVAERLGCYPFELERLATSTERLLTALHALLTVQQQAQAERPDRSAGWQADRVTLAERAEVLRCMVGARLNETAVTLTRVKGIGATLAKRLVENGISDIDRLARSDIGALAGIRGISSERAERLVADAKLVATLRNASSYSEPSSREQVQAMVASLPAQRRDPQVDPYRLRRALELRVTPLGGRRFRVVGGSDPHIVKQLDITYRCDCGDFRKGQRNCKHVLAVRMHRQERTVASALTAPADGTNGSNGLDLMRLWADRGPTDRSAEPRCRAGGWR
jgi:helicase